MKGSDEFVVIATTRPETLFGDTAVAVNPDDARYSHLIGKTLILPLVGREIPVIADEYVDKDFGTGCVKITPAHDPNDFEVGQRHNLEQIKVMNDDATMNAYAGKYEGMDRYECRRAMVEDLEKLGLLVKVEDHAHNVGQCYRCGTTVEPIISKQWFVKMKPLAAPAIDAVKNGETTFVPKHFEKVYFHWLENIRDWCISRQLWWGHRIPAFYCTECGKMTVSKEDITVCPHCGGRVEQDPDTLDTWFSSALWPFSTLGWPDKTEDLDYFYPTSTLVTGYDIIPFWVMRMMFSGIEHTGRVPFDHVFIHGLVRDAQGRKMSKSLGNGIDPLEIIDKYGADALRFTLATGNAPGNDMRFSTERVEASRNFANKIWNASRFALMNIEITENRLPEIKKAEDKWIVSKYNTLVREVTENLDRFELGVAVSKLYDFIWDDLCDWYIELVKPRLFDKGSEDARDAQYVLTYVLSNTMKLLHPFMPFITEEIWQHLPHEGESIVIAKFPEYDPALSFPEAEHDMQLVMDAISAVRNRRAEMNVPPSKKARILVVSDRAALYKDSEAFFMKLAGASEVDIAAGREDVPEGAVNIVVGGAELFLPMAELVDKQKELERLEKEKKDLEAEIDRVEKKLANQGFVAKAPQKVVDEERAKGDKYREMLEKVIVSIEATKKL